MKSKAPKRRQMPCRVSLLQGKRRNHLKLKCTHSGPLDINDSSTPGMKSTTRITKNSSITHMLPKKTVFLEKNTSIIRLWQPKAPTCCAMHSTARFLGRNSTASIRPWRAASASSRCTRSPCVRVMLSLSCSFHPFTSTMTL